MTRSEALAGLGLPDDAPPAAVKNRYRELMMQVHPDQGGSHEAALRISELYKAALNAPVVMKEAQSAARLDTLADVAELVAIGCEAFGKGIAANGIRSFIKEIRNKS